MHIIEHQMAHNGRALPGAKNTKHPQTVIKKKKTTIIGTALWNSPEMSAKPERPLARSQNH
jgi:hypothetical protein